ncbi:MAG: right-handed parallel beta-helix repeat-containing protein [Armatimonadetes bacterium]|nr:right-handed parallel beta-helix repeat-containing protein [Armatimonadota bacterium]
MLFPLVLAGHMMQGSFTIVRKGDQLRPTKEDLSQPALEIKGDNQVLDYKNLILRGSKADTAPDERKGLGVRVSGNNITIKNLTVHGYKVGLIAENCKNLKLIDCNFSYNWKQHLKSTLEKEDLSDWMSYHQNEKDEWLRYGAGAYFKNVDGFEVRNLTVVGGQCGLMLMRSNHGLVWNSNLSYLSGIGLGLYRSSDNRVMHNNIDYCVRGYSHGVYNRGQDSAGILIYEQSNKNVFAYNSVTHGGDGFFLWAGQTTMDTGEGGCNDNLVYGNDFSHAPTNGIEATFSRNKFVNNKVDECWHGFWTGYSFDTLMAGNTISNCEEGIAHEHGQDNNVEFNSFSGNKTDIHIWANPGEDPNWGYPKHHDTKSRDWKIHDNTFYSAGKTLRVSQTDGLSFANNTLFGASFDIAADVKNAAFADTCIHGDQTKIALPTNVVYETTKWEPTANQIAIPAWSPMDKEDAYGADSPAPLKGGKMPFIPSGGRRGRSTILVDDWGPYDYQSPKLWPGPRSDNGWQKYSIFGPKGTWKLKRAEGLEVSWTKGQVPGMVNVKVVPGSTEQRLELVYTGKAFTDFKGVTHKAGESFSFSMQKFDLPIAWTIKFFTFDKDTEDPRTQFEAYQAKSATAGPEFHHDKLDYSGYGKYEKGVPNNFFGTIAEGTFTVKPGEYSLEVTADDGVRVWLDDKLVIDAWKYQGPTLYTYKAKLTGKHRLKVNHFQLDGYSALQFRVEPAKD